MFGTIQVIKVNHTYSVWCIYVLHVILLVWIFKMSLLCCCIWNNSKEFFFRTLLYLLHSDTLISSLLLVWLIPIIQSVVFSLVEAYILKFYTCSILPFSWPTQAICLHCYTLDNSSPSSMRSFYVYEIWKLFFIFNILLWPG